MRIKALSVFALALVAGSVVSCSEDTVTGAGCPVLCPAEAPPLKDTIIDAVVFDTSVAGFPAFGFETQMLLAKRGDTLDSRIVTRYDTLPSTYSAAGQDSTIVDIDSAYVTAHRVAADSLLAFTDSTRLEVYDVTDAPDTAVADLNAQFVAGNLLGVRQYLPGDRPDTIRVWLDTARVRQRVVDQKRFHIGVRMVTNGSEQLRIVSADDADGFQLTIHASPDTTVAPLTVHPTSDFPEEPAALAPVFSDFVYIAQSRPMPANVLRVGGFPGRRVMLRFNIPTTIVDSAAVIRATLQLVQSPMTSTPGAGDTLRVFLVPIVVSSKVTGAKDILEFAGAPGTYAVDSVTFTPKDSVVQSLEMVKVVQAWRGQDTLKTPHLIGLEVANEGTLPNAIDFFSLEAPVEVRPRLRITYVTKLTTGRP